MAGGEKIMLNHPQGRTPCYSNAIKHSQHEAALIFFLSCKSMYSAVLVSL